MGARQRRLGQRRTPARVWAVACALCLVCAAGSAATASADDDAPSLRPPPVLEAPPDELSDEDLARYWSEATAIELQVLTDEEGRDQYEISRELERASNYFERVAEAPSGNPAGHWRAARAVWLSGEVLPLEEKEEKLDRFMRAEALLETALERNPECAECMLWKFIAMGRVLTTGGIMDAMRAVPEMHELLERALELQPTHRDNENNSSLGNLYYSSAIFNRMLPDWFFMKWLVGVRGDKWKALEHSRKALELHPNRLDFKIEVATQLLCIGTAKKKKDRLAEGRRIMAEAIALVPETEDERREVYFAKKLLEEPKQACGYTGDDIVDIDQEDAKRRASGKDDEDRKKKAEKDAPAEPESEEPVMKPREDDGSLRGPTTE